VTVDRPVEEVLADAAGHRAQVPNLAVESLESGVHPTGKFVKPLIGPGEALHRPSIVPASARNTYQNVPISREI
jgi:hypothetical protein